MALKVSDMDGNALISGTRLKVEVEDVEFVGFVVQVLVVCVTVDELVDDVVV